jgi:hypothetical protein
MSQPPPDDGSAPAAASVDPDALQEEPPTGCVVAIDWGGHYQEVWVSSRENIGNWYTTDIRLREDWHPTWHDLRARARGRTLTLLVAGDEDTFRAGYDAGVEATAVAVEAAVDEARFALPERALPAQPPPEVARLREAAFRTLRK